MSTRKPYQPSSFDRWVLGNPGISVTIGVSVGAIGALMVFLNEFGVTPSPLRFLAYGLTGVGVAFVVMPRNLRKRLDKNRAE